MSKFIFHLLQDANTTFEIYCGIMDEREKILAFINNTFSPELVKEGV